MRIPVPDFTLVLTFMLRASFLLSFTRPDQWRCPRQPLLAF